MRVSSIDNCELPEKCVASLAVTTRPTTDAPERATTIPSAIRSPASEPWNTVFGCVSRYPAYRSCDRDHGARAQGHRLGHRRRWRRGSCGNNLHRLLYRSSRRGWWWGRRRGRRGLSHLLVPPFRYRLCRTRWPYHQVVHDCSNPIDGSAVRGRQSTGRVIVHFAVQRCHAIGHGDLNILSSQRRLSRDLCLNVTANLLVVARRWGSRLCLLCSRLFCRRRRALHPDPKTRKPVKTTSGMLRRVKKSVLIGRRSSVLPLSCLCSTFDEGNRPQAGTSGDYCIHQCCLSTGCKVKVFAWYPGAKPPVLAEAVY